MTLLELELEGLPPTVNHLYGMSGRRKYKTPEGKAYQERVISQMQKQYSAEPYTGPVGLRIVFTTADRRRWDIDNRVKALQDCLTMAGVLADDRQVDILHVERKYGAGATTHLQLEVFQRG